MNPPSRQSRVLLAHLLVLFLIAGMVLPAAAQPVRHDRVVSANVTSGTPHALDGRVFAFAQVGNRMVVGGTFTRISEWNSSTPIDRSFLFSFNVNTGAIDHNFAPELNGRVEALQPAPDGQSVFVAGQFRTVDGRFEERIARLRVADGSPVPGFEAGTNGRINDIAVSGDRLFLGGIFREVNGEPRTVLAAVDVDTGALDRGVDFEFADPNFNRNNQGNLSVRKLDATPDGTQLVVIGNYGTIDGERRHQVSIFDIAADPARLLDWHTERYRQDLCANAFASYVNDMEIAPDGSYFVVVTTGAYRANTLCDTVARWNLGVTGSNLQPEWVNYSGGDTFWGVGASGAAVYAGGHQRWMNNPFAGDRPGPGAVDREGLAALDTRNGVPYSWDPGRNLGVGVFDMYTTSDRLWVGSDTDRIARWHYRGRLAAFPLQGAPAIPPADPGPLPGTLYGITAENLPTDPSILHRVNAGGPALPATDALPNWAADNTTASPYRNSGSNAATWSQVPTVDASVPAHAPRDLYSSERWDPPQAPEMRWAFPVEAGREVEVRLYFANRCTCTQQVGQRRFDVEINGEKVLDNYDIVADVGHDVGLMKSYPATSDGSVVIEFLHRTENPLINGIEIVDPALEGDVPDLDDSLTRQSFDGQTVGSPTAVGGSGLNGARTRDGFMLSGRLYTADTDGNLHARDYDGTSFGQPATIDLNGLGSAQFPVSNLTGLFYEHTRGRLWYTVAGQSRLFYRYFTPESEIVGAETYQGPGNLSGLDWRNVRGMHLGHDGYLYYGSTDGNLRRIRFDNGSLNPSTIEVLSGPATGDSRSWNNVALFLYSPPGFQAPNLDPVPRISVTCAGLTCHFGSTGSHDPDGEIVGWQWNFGDGAGASGPGGTHTYGSSGSYTATLTVTDDRGGTASTSVDVSVPWAVASMTASCVDLTCTFDASASTGRDGVAEYAWTMGDGQTRSGELVEHTFAQPGTYEVGLTVTDGAGSTDSTTQRVTIRSTPSSIGFVGKTSDTGNQRGFNLSVPQDVRGGDTLLLFLSLNKDLESEPQGVEGWEQLDTILDGNLRTTVWTRTAVTGDEGRPVHFQFDEWVKGDAVLAAYQGTSVSDPIAAFAGAAETVSRAEHTTPQVNTTADDHWVVSYWADRSSDTSAWTAPAGQTKRHEDVGPGPGRVSALLTDSADGRPAGVAGGLTATADNASNRATMWTFVLAPRGYEPAEAVPPVAQFQADCDGLVCQFDGSGSVGGSAPITGFSWDLGDGTTASNSTVEHIFDAAGEYTVTLTVTDADGRQHATSEQLAVAPPVSAVITASCTDLSCEFDGSTSSGGAGEITAWEWDLGDGATATDPTVDHTYPQPGEYEISLTVTNDEGASATDTVSITVEEAPAGIEFAGLSHSNATQRLHELQIPGTVRGGDGLLLFVTINTGDREIGAPTGTGWQELTPDEAVTPSDMQVRVWHKAADTGDEGQTVQVELDGPAKTDATLLAYKGTDAGGPAAAFAASGETVRRNEHTTPALTTDIEDNRVVSYWAQKSSATTTWTAPAGEDVRQLAVGEGGGRLAVLATDTGPNPGGTYGELTAVADSSSAKATMWTLVLKPR